MNDLNSILLEGNLTHDPELKVVSEVYAVTSANIAVNRFFKKANGEYSEEVSYFRCEAWNGLGEKLAEIPKGSRVRVIGRLKQDRWITDEGENRSIVKVIAEHFEVIRRKSS